MPTTIVATPDRETPKQIHLVGTTDSPTATTMDWDFGDTTVQAGAAIVGGSSKVSHTYATTGPFAVSAQPQPAGTLGNLAGVSVAARYQPRALYDPFSPWVPIPVVRRSGEPTEKSSAPRKGKPQYE